MMTVKDTIQRLESVISTLRKLGDDAEIISIMLDERSEVLHPEEEDGYSHLKITPESQVHVYAGIEALAERLGAELCAGGEDGQSRYFREGDVWVFQVHVK